MIRRRELFGALGAFAAIGVSPPATSREAASAFASDPASACAALRSGWEFFARQFVLPDGRVVDTGNQGITHTEGLGTALLVAQACDDRARFDKVWSFCSTLRRSDGLHSWKWAVGKGIPDANNATDGDLYIAWALLRAGQRWRDAALIKASAELAKTIRENLVVLSPKGRVLLPGKEGFVQRNASGVERAVVNPSYWVLPAYRELQVVDSSPGWDELYRSALALMEHARFGPQGLPSDWLMLDDPVAPWRERPARFGFEAIRVPLFLVWAQKSAHPAVRACAKLMQQPGFPAWVALDSVERAGYAAPAGFEAVARLVRKSVFNQPLPALTVQGDYYSSALGLLSLLAAQDLGWV